jgi:hypothetical protein
VVNSIFDNAINSIVNKDGRSKSSSDRPSSPLSPSRKRSITTTSKRGSISGGSFRSRLGSHDNSGGLAEGLTKKHRVSDTSWTDTVRISFLECMLFVMWDYRRFIKKGWYKSTPPTFDFKGFCKSFLDQLSAVDREIEKEKREETLAKLSLGM